ncbi:MAG: NUDIX domain-containing protein [Parachlamydiales bacterium]|jgi:8-oxo-dGTP pyrophosphatase MutT (NUDIX family)
MKSIKFEYTSFDGETKIYEVEPKEIKFFIDKSTSEGDWYIEGIDLRSRNKQLFLLNNIKRIIDEKVQRFFCVTVYVMDNQNRFLMMFHKKLNKWVPPGGKVDNHETPDEAAQRECFEETGCEIELIGPKTEVEGGLMKPFGSQLNVIVPNSREHVDLIYLGKPKNIDLKISEREASDIGWFSYDEVTRLSTFPSVIKWCEYFLNYR